MSDGASTDELHSGYYVGRVEHRRRTERTHDFGYQVAWIYLDLAERDVAFEASRLFSGRRWAPFRFQRSDYLRDPDGGVDGDLAEAARSRVAAELGRTPSGAVRVLTQLRALGFLFNPVSFYYCFEGSGADERLDAIVAEITNTPWGERHSYVLDAAQAGDDRSYGFEFDKVFHVSPFFDMDQRYRWRFVLPSARPASVDVQMTNIESGEAVFHAGMRLERLELTARNLHRIALRFGFQTWLVKLAIYWQAARLWWKRVPFFTHPDKRPAALDAGAKP